MATDSTARKMALSQDGGSYTLPKASTTVLGGVKVDGTTVTIDGNGVISSVGGGTGYAPDDVTIGLTVDNKLEIKEDILNTINGVGTEVAVADATTITQVMQPNVFYTIDADTLCTTLNLSLADPIATVASLYSAMIKCGATPPPVPTISGVTFYPTLAFEANKTTEINIKNGIGIFSNY